MVSGVIAFGIFELAIRYKLGAYPFLRQTLQLDFLSQKDVNLRWRFYPNKNGRNSLGIKAGEISKKGKDKFRILFLGDSLLWTGETSSGELQTKVIEDELNAKFGNRVETINAGVPGYTTYQEFEFLKQYGWDMQPDFIVLGFVFNDVYFKYLHLSTKRDSLDIEPDCHLHHFDTSTPLGRLFKRSFAAHMIWYSIEKAYHLISKSYYFPFERRDDFYLAWKEYGWHETENLIKQMNQELKDKNTPLLIVIFPVSDQVNPKYLPINKDFVLFPQKKITEITSKYNIPYIDLTEILLENGGIKLYRDYHHLNSAGNDVFVKVMSKYLESELKLLLK
jgi:lysophospholipase L1-like esterase